MAVQTAYSDTMDAARPGMIANTEPHNLISRGVEDAAGIGFGVAAAQGANDRGIKAFGAGDKFVGVVVRERSLNANNVGDIFEQYADARIMRKGTIWVVASVAVAAGDPITVDDATGDFGIAGNVEIAGRWETSAAAGELAKINLA